MTDPDKNPRINNPRENVKRFPGGRLDKFMPIPPLDNYTTWHSAGPILIGVEARAIGTREGEILGRGPSVHVFDATTNEEWLRFDCFDKGSHYHYILQTEQHNIVWGYDPITNGDIYTWVIDMLRERLGAMLQHAGANTLAEKVAQQNLDNALLDRIYKAMVSAYERTFPGTDMIEPSFAWAKRWKEIHPQFNTFNN